MGCLMGQPGSLAGVLASSRWLARATPEPSGTKHMTRRAFSGKAMLRVGYGILFVWTTSDKSTMRGPLCMLALSPLVNP